MRSAHSCLWWRGGAGDLSFVNETHCGEVPDPSPQLPAIGAGRAAPPRRANQRRGPALSLDDLGMGARWGFGRPVVGVWPNLTLPSRVKCGQMHRAAAALRAGDRRLVDPGPGAGRCGAAAGDRAVRRADGDRDPLRSGSQVCCSEGGDTDRRPRGQGRTTDPRPRNHRNNHRPPTRPGWPRPAAPGPRARRPGRGAARPPPARRGPALRRHRGACPRGRRAAGLRSAR